MAASQELYADFGAPLLFTLPSEQPAEYRTPLSRHSPLRDSGTISSARRSVTPPGSVHTDTTPPRPPPIMRLQDTLMTDAEGGAALSPPGAAAAAAAAQAAEQAAAAAAAAAAGGGNMMRVEGYTQPDDTWITVFGFTPDDLPLVLREFQRCGDILQWGTFGASPQSNFMHIQYQTKYGAQRALQRGGEQLSSSLIIGVKQLEPRHRALVEAWSSGGGADGRSPVRVKAPIGPVRPYKVDSTQAQALPMRSRTWMHKSKRPSLKEFYATHGPKQSPSRGHGHGTGAHDDRADDQGLHHRLAADCSLLDNGKPHPQRGSGRVKGGGGRRHGDRHGRRGDRSDVGDVEQQPQQQSHSQPNRSFCATRGRQRDGGRPAARHGNAAAGRESGQCSVADVPPAGVLPGPDAVGGRAPGYSGRSSSGSFGTPTGSSNSYSQGPRHGHGPPLPSSRNYANHPYGMPPGAGGMLPGRQWEQAPGPQGHLPAPGSAFQASPAGSHCSPAGCGYGPPGAAMGPVPLPPPPPRRSPSGRHPGPRSGVAAAPPTAAGPAAGAEGLGASSAQPTPAARGAAPAQGAAVPEAGAQAADAAGGCAGRTGSPFAAAPAALEAPAAAPAAVCPKNAFAERLAQRAMANAKSSVLAGTSSSSSAISRSPSLTRSGSAGAPVAHKPLPATGGASPPVFAAIPDISSASSSPTDHGSGPFVKPALLRGGRPELKPGSIHPLEAVPASGNYSSTSSDSGDAPADHGGSGSAASSLSGGRPRLHLLPRGSSGMAASSGGGGGAVKASVFGGARPREEVLRERGQDPADVDAAMGHSWTGEGGGHAPRAGGGTADAAAHDYNRSGAAGKEDCWHTVAGHGRRRLADEGAPGLLDGSFDPFFGDSSFRSGPRTSGGLGALPPPQAFGRDIMRAGHGGRHGSSGSFGGAGSAHAQAQGDGGYNNNDDDDAIFMRALPTRQKPLAL